MSPTILAIVLCSVIGVLALIFTMLSSFARGTDKYSDAPFWGSILCGIACCALWFWVGLLSGSVK